MTRLTRAVQFLVGILFVLSGLVKANDPMGLAYKMQEFFEVWTSQLGGKGWLVHALDFLNGYVLEGSVVMIALEVVAGVALMLGWRRKFTLVLLTVLIVFFTFLTAYAWGSGKFKNCGCFGDCLPLSPLTSLLKDILLCAAAVFLLWRQREMFILQSVRRAALGVGVSLLAVVGLQWYVLQYLPLADCLPYREGASIRAGMQMPPNAVTDSFSIRFLYEREGKLYEFAPSELPADLENYTYIDRQQKLIRQGNAEPAIKGFSLLTESGFDSTDAVLNHPSIVLIVGKNLTDTALWKRAMARVTEPKYRGSRPMVWATSNPDAVRAFVKKNKWLVSVLSCDDVPVRTLARTQGVVVHLQKGVVVEKRPLRSYVNF